MGWWSPTIMGSDAAGDAEDAILRMAKIPDDHDELRWEDDPTLAKRCLEAVSLADWKALFNSSSHPVDLRILPQVAAVMLMKVGAKLPEEVARAALHAGATEDCDSWDRPEDRRHHLQIFAAMIRAYDGTPCQPLSEQVFQKNVGVGRLPGL